MKYYSRRCRFFSREKAGIAFEFVCFAPCSAQEKIGLRNTVNKKNRGGKGAVALFQPVSDFLDKLFPSRVRKRRIAAKRAEKQARHDAVLDAADRKYKATKAQSEEDMRPLWEKYPDRYRKKRPFFVRLLGGIGSFILFWILAGGIVVTVAAGVGFTMVYSFTDPELDATLANLELSYTTQLLATKSDGTVVVYDEIFKDSNRIWTSVTDMPQYLLDATVAIEDKRFYQHKGIDPIRTASATIGYVLNKFGVSGIGSGGGGSTLTQQLIKNITKDNATSGWDGIERKFREILRALYIERKYEKDQILEYYLNVIPFHGEDKGVGTAAKYFFGKDVSELNLTECAALISVTNAPSKYDPYLKPENNKNRRDVVLRFMYDQGKISLEEYEQAKNTELVLADKSSGTKNTKVYSYFTDTVFEWLVSELRDQKGFSRSEAVDYIYNSGLRIYTTVDPDIQSMMEEYFENEDNYPELEGEEQPQVAMEILDPTTGNVLGIIGGRGKKDGSLSLNRATQTLRQVGSSIKPLTVYGLAIEENMITAASAIDDTPLYVSENVVRDKTSGKTYTSYKPYPSNYDSTYNGLIDIKVALSNSYNTPAMKVLQMVGIDKSFEFAKNMLRLDNLLESDKYLAPLSVGSLSKGLTLQELTAAYTVYANGGIYSAARCVTRVETYDGKTVLENDVDRSIVFSPQTSYIMTDILKRATTVGSSKVANLKPIATAGKSGTTSSFNDRWFIGYTPYYLGGIWWGYDNNGANDNTEHIRMWHDVMLKAHELRNITEAEFEVPDGLVTATYCSVSGMAPGPYCSTDPLGSCVKTGIFKQGTQPTETCSVHHQIYVCSESGQIAHENCPSAYLATFRDCSRSFPNAYVYVKDSEYICPPLSPTQVLYNDSLLPVYTYMLPEGEYPTLSNRKKARYTNCLCSTHAAGEMPHPYTFKFLSYDQQVDITEGQAKPAGLLSPSELLQQQDLDKRISIARQIYEETGELTEGITMEMMYPQMLEEMTEEVIE